MTLQQLARAIMGAKRRLQDIVNGHDSLLEPEVLEAAQALDELIVEYGRRRALNEADCGEAGNHQPERALIGE